MDRKSIVTAPTLVTIDDLAEGRRPKGHALIWYDERRFRALLDQLRPARGPLQGGVSFVPTGGGAILWPKCPPGSKLCFLDDGYGCCPEKPDLGIPADEREERNGYSDSRPPWECRLTMNVLTGAFGCLKGRCDRECQLVGLWTLGGLLDADCECAYPSPRPRALYALEDARTKYTTHIRFIDASS